MRYIYMHNFRGFSNTLIPLSQTSFLVGENSTGKSSFLKLLHLLFRPNFWFSPALILKEDPNLFGGYHDIVSAWAVDKTYFQVGMIRTKKDKENGLNVSFGIFTFIEKDGVPVLSRYLHLLRKKMTALIFTEKEIQYKNIEVQQDFSSDSDILDYFKPIIWSDREDTSRFSQLPQAIPIEMPLPWIISLGWAAEKGNELKIDGTEFEFPFLMDTLNLSLIAPIRTKPSRFYDALPRSFSPEGDHTPFILRQSLEAQTKSVHFLQKLEAFGSSSGLFETIVSHSFGGPQDPFELLIKFAGVQLNISNVGYGVSQVLPLIVEFLSEDKNKAFAVEEPEIHLHPRAQAALGELIYELAKERGHSFILETHSDYLIDRFRLSMHEDNDPPTAQVLFFQRVENGNHVDIIPISPEGRYPEDQPKAFREFFIKEEMALLEI